MTTCAPCATEQTYVHASANWTTDDSLYFAGSPAGSVGVIPASFFQGLLDCESGNTIDLDSALHSPPDTE